MKGLKKNLIIEKRENFDLSKYFPESTDNENIENSPFSTRVKNLGPCTTIAQGAAVPNRPYH